MSEPALVGFEMDLESLADIENTEPSSYPVGTGRLTAPNGAAKMKYTGEWQFHPKRRSFRDDEDVILEIWNEDIRGEIELTSTEAMRLGSALIGHAESQYRANNE